MAVQHETASCFPLKTKESRYTAETFIFVENTAMKLRIARHTEHLQPLIDFYCGILGMEYLGGFTGHEGYDGVFIGLKSSDWHLEFTTSHELPAHAPDEDDLLVFYCESQAIMDILKERLAEKGFNEIEPKNPYWRTHGTAYKDPDGFGVLLTVER